METTIMGLYGVQGSGYSPLKIDTIEYRGHVGIMEKKMETTILC